MVLMDLYSFLLNSQLSATLYQANLTSVTCTYQIKNNGIDFEVNGLEHSLDMLINDFITTLKALDDCVTADIFHVCVEQTGKGYDNKLINPKSLSEDLRLTILEVHHVTLLDKKKTLKKLTLKDFQLFHYKFLKGVCIKSFMFGNIVEEKAVELMEKVKRELRCKNMKRVSDLHLDNRAIQMSLISF